MKKHQTSSVMLTKTSENTITIKSYAQQVLSSFSSYILTKKFKFEREYWYIWIWAQPYNMLIVPHSSQKTGHHKTSFHVAKHLLAYFSASTPFCMEKAGWESKHAKKSHWGNEQSNRQNKLELERLLIEEHELCQLQRALPVKHDTPSDDVPHGHFVQHSAGVCDALEGCIRADQCCPNKTVVLDPDPDGKPVHAFQNRGGISLVARGGAKQGRERTAAWRGQAGAAEAGASG
jgi:hypothetical protein